MFHGVTATKTWLLSVALLLNCQVAQAKTFLIGVEAVNYYPLFDFSEHDVTRPSFTRDLLTRFFDLNHYQYQFIAIPIKRFDKWYVEKGIDFKFPDNERWREEKGDIIGVRYSQSVIKLLAGSFVLKSRLPMARNEVKKLGTVLGFIPTLWFDRLEKKQLNLVEEASPYSIVKHVLYNNVDATNIDLNVIQYNLDKMDRAGEIVLNTSIPHEVYSYHLSTIKYPNIIKQFDEFLISHRDFIEQLKQRYHIKEDFVLTP